MIDDEQLDKEQEKAEQKRKEQLADLSEILDHPAGRRVLRRILDRTGPLRQTFDIENERLSSMRAGERNIGLWIIAELIEARPTAVGGLLFELQKPSRLDESEG